MLAVQAQLAQYRDLHSLRQFIRIRKEEGKTQKCGFLCTFVQAVGGFARIIDYDEQKTEFDRLTGSGWNLLDWGTYRKPGVRNNLPDRDSLRLRMSSRLKELHKDLQWLDCSLTICETQGFDIYAGLSLPPAISPDIAQRAIRNACRLAFEMKLKAIDGD